MDPVFPLPKEGQCQHVQGTVSAPKIGAIAKATQGAFL